MDNILLVFAFFATIIVITKVMNDKFFRISNNIALLISSFCLSVGFVLGSKFGYIDEGFFVYTSLNKLPLDKLLLEGVLCFMIFAGASKLQFSKFVNNIKSISILSLLTTVINTLIYGGLFYGISCLFNLQLNFIVCLLMGCIISPTDPIAATSILSKLGLPKGISSVIEGESLFNDGIGVAIFAFLTGFVTQTSGENFAVLIAKSLFGSIAIGLVISFVLFTLLKQSKDPQVHIIISLLDVSLSYVICEFLGCSGVIASVVCGIYFSYHNKKCERWKQVVDSSNLYLDFWDIIDEMLNNMLFVLIGLTVCIIPIHKEIIILIPAAIIINFVSRYVSVWISTNFMGKKSIPNKYDLKSFTKLMTVTALRGGLSLAMALSAVSILQEHEYVVVLNVTMVSILFTTIIQGMMIPFVYKGIERKRDEKYLNT